MLREWSRQTDKFVDELLRLEGPRGYSLTACPTCPPTRVQIPRYRCNDCIGGDITCADCCVVRHQNLPYHRVKVSTSYVVVEVPYSHCRRNGNRDFSSRRHCKNSGWLSSSGTPLVNAAPPPDSPRPAGSYCIRTDSIPSRCSIATVACLIARGTLYNSFCARSCTRQHSMTRQPSVLSGCLRRSTFSRYKARSTRAITTSP